MANGSDEFVAEPVSAIMAKRGIAERLAISQIINPRLGIFVGDIGTDEPPVPRDKLSMPVSPVPNPDDTTLFESHGDPSEKLYLPRYRIVDKPPLQLSLAQGATDWTLTVVLEKYPAPELGTAWQSAAELPHTLSVVVRYNLLIGNAVAGVKELPLDELTIQRAGVKAVLRGQQTTLRDQLFLAMTDPTYAPVLIVKRVAKVALPVPGSSAVVVSSGQGTLRGTWMFSFDSGGETSANADVWWDQMTDVQRQLVPQGNAQIVNLGAADFDAIDANALQGYSYSTAPIPGSADATNQLTPGDVFAVHTVGGNYAKVQIVTYGYNLLLRWVTYAPVAQGRPILFSQVGNIEHLEGRPPPSDPTSSPLEGVQNVDLGAVIEGVAGANESVPPPTSSQAEAVQHIDLSHVMRERAGVDETLREGEEIPPRIDRVGVQNGPGHIKRIFPPWPRPVNQPPPPTLYRETVYTDEERLAPDPFVFSTASYVFVNLGQVGGSFGLERNDVDYHGHSHSYYRDLSEPWVFYYLPDQFKLGRRDQLPHAPAMSVKVQATDETLDHTTVTLTYLAMPYVDRARIAAATAALAPRLTLSSLPPGVTGPVLLALQTDQQSVTYSLSLPSTAGGGFQVRDRAVVDLRAGIGDTITASLGDFQSIYNALFTDTELFRGVLEVRLGAGAIHTEHIDLVGRLSDMAGAPPIDITQHADEAASTVTVTLTNAIESPVEIRGLASSLARDGAGFAATIQGLDVSTPVRLAPGAGTSFTVVPASPPAPGQGELAAVLDLSGLKVLPDPQAVWTSILDAHAPNEYERIITLEVYQSAFSPPADNPQDQVLAIQVDFVQDGTIEVTPAQMPAAGGTSPSMLAVKVPLHLPISDYVLNTPQRGQFQYRVTRVRTSGSVVENPITVTLGDIVRVQ